jgi:RNA polymerase sigma factor (sigma-70 family)
MTRTLTDNFLQVVRRAVSGRSTGDVADNDLLAEFIDRHDEAAFVALLRRHGPMVLDVCRSLLPNPADAEDAFQATFLILATKAASIRKMRSLSSWLHGVAYRTARRAQTEFARRRKHERRAVRPESTRTDEMTWPEVQRVLHEELNGLSQRYRQPLILCYLQGQTLAEAAAQLGLGKSTLKLRLEQGRYVLRARLVRRGLGSAGVLLAATWPGVTEAGLPATLLGSTTSAALATAAGRTAATAPRVADWTTGGLSAMRFTKFTRITVVAAALALAGSGVGWLAYAAWSDPPATAKAAATAAADRTQPGQPVLVLQVPPVVSVNSVAVSPDGALVATAADGVRLYDARTGDLVRALGEAGGRSVAFSPDGKLLAAAGFHLEGPFGHPQTTLPIYDVQTGKRVQTLAGHTEWETYAVAFAPDGKTFASSGADKQVLLWDLATGKILHRLAGPTSPVTALAFSPDAALLAGGGADKTVRLWDTATGRLRRSLTGHRDWVCALTFAPDGKSLVAGCCDWASHRGRDMTYLPGGDPGCVSYLRLWDVASGESRRDSAVKGRVRSFALEPHGKVMVCGVGKEVRLFDLGEESRGRVVTSHDSDVTSVAFTNDGSAVISGGHDHTVKRTDLATGRTDWQALGHFEQVNAVALSKDGTLLATGSGDGRYAQRVFAADAKPISHGAVRLWDARTGRLLRQLGDSDEQMMAVALSPDGKRLASGGGSGVVRLWDTKSGKPVWSADDPKAEVLAIAYGPDGSVMASAAANGVVNLRDPEDGHVLQALEDHPGGATSLAFSADGSLLVCGDGHGAAHLWEVKTGRRVRTFQAASRRAVPIANDRLFTSVALSPDGETLMSCAATVGNTFNEPVRFWDVRSGRLKNEITTEAHSARPATLSPDGSILATGGKSIKLWDVRSGKQLRELFGYLKKTQAIAFSADGRLIYSGGSYGTTNAWEVATGRHLVTLFTFPGTGKGAAAADWLAYNPEGFYDGSPGIEHYLAWRIGEDLQTPDSRAARQHHLERVECAMKLDPPRPGSR